VNYNVRAELRRHRNHIVEQDRPFSDEFGSGHCHPLDDTRWQLKPHLTRGILNHRPKLNELSHERPRAALARQMIYRQRNGRRPTQTKH
jgi:hypothetical protein